MTGANDSIRETLLYKPPHEGQLNVEVFADRHNVAYDDCITASLKSDYGMFQTFPMLSTSTGQPIKRQDTIMSLLCYQNCLLREFWVIPHVFCYTIISASLIPPNFILNQKEKF
ncbi:hypothetical protein GQX74_014736 [Glossina fuscipes]|nr:hypothetical protein GQX74_014736 [Glossina fuscipes]